MLAYSIITVRLCAHGKNAWRSVIFLVTVYVDFDNAEKIMPHGSHLIGPIRMVLIVWPVLDSNTASNDLPQHRVQ